MRDADARLTSVGLAWWQGGLSLRLTKPHGGLPAGTQLLIALRRRRPAVRARFRTRRRVACR